VREDIAPIFTKDFVDVKIDEAMVGFEELIGTLGGKGNGFPWLVILRPDGSTIIDSNDPDQGNIGSPRAEWEIEHWNVMMRASTKRITGDEIEYMGKTWAEDRPGGESSPRP
jgi:hypothetical protein